MRFMAELVLLALPLSIVDAVAVVTTVFDVLSPPKNYPAWANVGMAMLLALRPRRWSRSGPCQFAFCGVGRNRLSIAIGCSGFSARWAG
jgi:hypothetical protein